MQQTVTAIGGVEQDLEEILTHWKTWMTVSRNLSPNTQRLYLRTVETASAAIPSLLDADSAALEAWVQGKGGKPGTVANRIVALTCFYRFLVKTKYRLDNPTTELDRPRQHRGVPKPVEDLEAVLVALDRVDEKANLWSSDQRRVGETRDMAVFLAETGLRIHEAVALSVPLPIPDAITITGKGNKEAIVLLNSRAREALERLGGCWPIKARATQRRFEKAGIHPHALRHTFATNLVRKGVEIGTVSKLCRHSSPSVTMVYAQYDTRIMRAAIGD